MPHKLEAARVLFVIERSGGRTGSPAAHRQRPEQRLRRSSARAADMAKNGVWQLRKLVLNYCDWGGSSRGARWALPASARCGVPQRRSPCLLAGAAGRGLAAARVAYPAVHITRICMQQTLPRNGSGSGPCWRVASAAVGRYTPSNPVCSPPPAALGS